MNKKIILLIVLAVVIGVVGFLTYSIMNSMQAKEKLVQTTPMPDFTFQTLDGNSFGKQELAPGLPTLIMHFDPGCDHCEFEAQELVQHIALFNNTQVLMVTASDKESTERFADNFGLKSLPEITILLDTDEQFFNAFGSITTPCSFAYNKDFELVEYFAGSVKMEVLRKRMDGITENE